MIKNNTYQKKQVAIVGGGPAALTLAIFLDPQLFEVTIYEHKKNLGRKFLVAGKGGFNISHSEPIHDLIERYTPNHFLKKALLTFSNHDLRKWFASIAIPTFIGSSKRIYPEKEIKPIEVLNKIISILEAQKVTFKFEHLWTGWNNEDELLFNIEHTEKADYTIFALGGASWKITGSDGNWLTAFQYKGIKTVPFSPSNCAYEINWKPSFIDKNEGLPLKNIQIKCGNQIQKGEAVITRFGIEGNAIYGLSPQIQASIRLSKKAEIYIDLKPSINATEVLNRLTNSKEKNTSLALKKDLKLNSLQIDLVKNHVSKEDFLDLFSLSKKIKALPLTIVGSAPIDDAISTAGGIDLSEVDEHFELRKLKNTFCIGEMLDWNAPTGGYLLQACFSMGATLAEYLNKIKNDLNR